LRRAGRQGFTVVAPSASGGNMRLQLMVVSGESTGKSNVGWPEANATET
jgi:hypothetical protein